MNDDERVLIEKILNQDLNSFDILIEQYKGRIYTLCLKIMGEHEEADDCAQETFIRVFRFLKSFRFQSSFYTWIYRIAVNTCRNRLKSAEYRRIHKNRQADYSHLFEAIHSKSGNPQENLEQEELRKRIHEEILKLKEEFRILIVLRDLDGKSYEEIGEITGLNPGTVKSRLARARESVRLALKGEL
jgi:RNA polymerase sigma-70 factor (ECF subfamily)